MASNLAKKFKQQRVVEFNSFLREKSKGKDGMPGAQGSAGQQGASGPAGVHGRTGPKGDTGPQGPQGPIGPQGATGHNGVDGVVGARGADGPMPKHEVRGDALRFEQAPGVWGKWINLPNFQHQQNISVGSIQTQEVIDLIALFGGSATVDENTLIDTVGDFKYIGTSTPGTATSAAAWKIKRVDLSDAGGDIPILFANGTALYDKIWDDRATYTYTVTGS